MNQILIVLQITYLTVCKYLKLTYQRYYTILLKQKLRKQNKKYLPHGYKKMSTKKFQETTSTCWVVSPKVIDGAMSAKVYLVARRLEEKKDQAIRSHSLSCLQESVCLFFFLAASNEYNVGWIDIEWAFLQGYNIGRDRGKPAIEAKTIYNWKFIHCHFVASN